MQRSHYPKVPLFLAVLTAALAAGAPAQQPDYTIQSATRVVLTDVTVTDRHGNPVSGLTQADFQILDNRAPQAISSFEEHLTRLSAPPATAALPPGLYSNDLFQHLPPVLNIVVLDIKNIEIEDQMFLNQRLERLIATLPSGEPLAIYWCRGPHTILLQPFTSDHGLLLAAMHKALPRFPPTGRAFFSDYATLHQIASDLNSLPGRKNILWFTGGSTLYLQSDGGGFQAPDMDPAKIRAVFDELESSRIAIFPIDARGLVIGGAGAGNFALFAQHTQMEQVAEATGGHAYYNSNGLDTIAAHLLDSDGSFYTLTYSPADLHFDNKWHKVEIKLKRNTEPYFLSYRRGYFADATSAGDAQAGSGKPARRLLAGGTLAADEMGEGNAPIVFQVKVLPADQTPVVAASDVSLPFNESRKQRGTVRYTLRYALPLSAFKIKTAGGQPQVLAGIALMVFNQSGTVASRFADRVTFDIRPDKLALAPQTVVSVKQQVDLPAGDDSLYCTVWDVTSHRMGTIQVPVQVSKHSGTRGQ